MTPRWTLACVVLLVTAGCLGESPAAEEIPAPAEEGVVIDESRPDTSFNAIATGPAAQPDLNATLDAPPKLVAGEWWRLAFETPLAESGHVEVVRVVAAVEPGGYVIGMPHEGWYKEVISYHSPALGDVGLDLSYATHNIVFQPVKFPLVEGNTWETAFATQPYTAVVESTEGTKATVVLTPIASGAPTDPVFEALGFTGGEMRLVYDASVHEVVHFSSGIGTYEVVEHGYDFEGWVTIPRGMHTAIDYGQLGPLTPGELPQKTIEVAGGYNRLTMMHAVFPIGPGTYRVSATAPDGTQMVTESTGMDGVVKFYEVADPDGTWQTEDLVLGVGGTYSMGIAYHQYDIRLPDGAKRSDHSHEVIR